MFTKFTQSKNHYEKAQIFPFLIAILVVCLILIMLTVNLGQLNSFKTDVSNAADSAALASASVLSGALLGLGLKSEMMAGYAIVSLVAIIIFIIFVVTIPAAIATYIAFLVSQYTDYFMAIGEGKMAWTNAKQTALSFGFINSGVDEPRPTFKQFLSLAYQIDKPEDLPAEKIKQFHQEYILGQSNNAHKYARAGFSKFMEDNKKGFWSEDEFARVRPSETAPVTVTNGYGFSQNPDLTFSNSYSDRNGHKFDKPGKYRSFDNYVEVQVIGSSMYPLALDSFLEDWVTDCIRGILVDMFMIPWWVRWMYCPVCFLLDLVMWMFLAQVFPTHLTFSDSSSNFLKPEDSEKAMKETIDDNHILVKVTRYKKNQNLGLWNFTYGRVQAHSVSRAFREHAGDKFKTETIEQVCIPSPCQLIKGLVEGGKWGGICQTERHLFETELVSAF